MSGRNLTLPRHVVSVVDNKIPTFITRDMERFLNSIENLKLYGPGNLRTKLYIFLYYLIKGIGQQSLERETGFPHSDAHQCFGTLRRKLVKWAKGKIRPLTYSKRLEITNNYVRIEKFLNTTLLMDSKDFKISKQDSLHKKSPHHSYKENSPAIRVQFCSTHDMIVRWIAGPFTPKTYDSKCIKQEIEDFKAKFTLRDIVMADNHYTTVYAKKRTPDGPTFINRYIKPRNGKFTTKQNKFNTRFSAVRSRIETNISHITERFGWLSKKWMKSRESLYDVVVIATAINNCVMNKSIEF